MFKRVRAFIVLSILLLGVVLAINFLWKNNSGDREYTRMLEEKLAKVVSDFDEDYIQLLMNNKPDIPVSFLTLNIEANHPYFLFSKDGELVYWSDITMIPAFGEFVTNKKFQLFENKKGVYFGKLRTLNRNGTDYWFLQVFRLIDHVEVVNEYLSTGINRWMFGNDRFALSQERREGYQPLSIGEDYLFSVFFRVGYEPAGRKGNTTLLIFFFSLLGLVAIKGGSFIHALWVKGFHGLAMIYTSLILGSIRLLMLFFRFPQDYFESALFSATQYASSWLNPSLGDLLLNFLSITLILLMLFLHWSNKRVLVGVTKFRDRLSETFFYVSVLLISKAILALFFGVYLDIAQNSQWNLNIHSLTSFDILQGVSLLILFISGMLYFLFTSILLMMARYRGSVSRKRALNILLYISTPVAVGLFFYERQFLVAYLAHFILVGALIGMQLYRNIFRMELDTFLTFFFGCLVGAVVIGVASFYQGNLDSLQSKRKFADYVMLEEDVMGSYLLGEVMENIRDDLFIRNRMADPLLSKDPIEQKIKKIYLTNYLDNFVPVVRVFSRSGESLTQRESSLQLDEYRLLYMNSDFSTSVRNLYYIRGGRFGSPNKFVAFISMYREAAFLGTIMLELTQQRVMANSVFPKLLVDRRYVAVAEDQWMDYAIFDEGVLQFSSGVFNYRSADLGSLLADPRVYGAGVSHNGYHHLAIQGEGQVVVVSSPEYPAKYMYADVAMFFVVFLVFTLLAILLYTLVLGRDWLKFNYATKLQFYLNFAFFFPMVVISMIAVGFLSSSYTEDLHRQYFDKAQLIRDNLSKVINAQSIGFLDREELISEIYTLAGSTNTDLNLYLPDGRLLASTQPRIFEKKILSGYISPRAYEAIVESQNSRVLLNERVGNLGYKTVYLGLRDPDLQRIRGIIAIPFFESEDELNVLIADVVSNILVIFMVMFVVFLTVSYFISKHLTYPFKLLTQKLKATNLEGNEYMRWPSQDEIGLLVDEYNNMLSKLEASKKVLASNEKESAWREMAKQVAHEIKNPLTPMKLTLQHLLRLQAEGRIDDPDKLKRPLGTLIHQVDVLSDIATSFSTFAKMPLPENEVIDFRLVVSEAIELFSNREDISFSFSDEVPVDRPLFIMGDPKLFGRVISNLIINGIQAVEKPITPEIKVVLSYRDERVLLEIRDNGKGIPDDLRDKIFIPNFSTKSEGSGLGLAIAKRGVETAGGNIWFETSVDKGSSFFLSFPVLA